MQIIRRWQRSLYKKMVKYNIVTPKVVVLIDGGICSQMHQYLIGKLFENKGYAVVFDLAFYREWGSDLNYRFARNFDLLKAFPYLKMQEASDLEVDVYKQKYYNLGNNTTHKTNDFSFLEKEPPVYLGGYYYLPSTTWLPVFKSIFRLSTSVLDKPNQALYSEIGLCHSSVAVHVRRGDLAVEIPAYGRPATVEYFQSAISYINEKTEESYFYFFSDEPEWVHDELIPCLNLSLDKDCKIVDINGSDRGYMDLFLIANCTHQITSKGTLGKYGALLNDNMHKIVVLYDDEVEHYWRGFFKNPVFL
ncbi:alpha-1,2-fucosyltransferase [Bacteroides sp.]|uniref:alpha-1,2-fucosyltransferase n=1 Tax=Bacteroides sp. TaxID=29523 RepID=UPI0025BD5E53|nr:alpha-1,2-fucosyltransferase [Bacteroides sp.]